MTSPEPRTDRLALSAALACFTTWGLFPLLFQAVGRAGATSWEAVGWRILASIPCGLALVAATGQLPACRALLRQPRTLGALGVSGLLIGANWGVYIWAVQHGQTLATSFGYYLNPLLNVATGAVLFRERLGRAAWVAIVLALAGVGLQAAAIGGLPWIALVLAASFCIYGVIRKQVPVEAQTGLFIETLVLALPSLLLVTYEARHGGGGFGHRPLATVLLLACGPATVAPLTAFAIAARRLPLSVLGFLQFIQPTILFFVGALQGEPVSAIRLVSFGFIWLGVGVFVAGLFAGRPARPAARRAAAAGARPGLRRPPA
jgi:chloramphenicol-sensitive protein RarD